MTKNIELFEKRSHHEWKYIPDSDWSIHKNQDLFWSAFFRGEIQRDSYGTLRFAKRYVIEKSNVGPLQLEGGI